MAKKLYVCSDITAREVGYEFLKGCGIEADNVQDALDLMCDKLNNKVKDKHFEQIFETPSLIWEVKHNLGKMVSVFMEDLEGNDIEGDIEYANDDVVVVYFKEPVAGKIFIN